MRTIRLTRGLGEEGKSHCVMAATSIVAGERFTDNPKCVCPTITSALMVLNDSYGHDDAAREEALGHLPWIIIGTRGTSGHKRKRAFLFADWVVRVCCDIECDPIVDDATAHAARVAVASAGAYDAAYAALAAGTAASQTAAYAAASQTAAYAAGAASSAGRRKDLIAYIESTIIPVYTTMPIEPGFRAECLITV